MRDKKSVLRCLSYPASRNECDINLIATKPSGEAEISSLFLNKRTLLMQREWETRGESSREARGVSLVRYSAVFSELGALGESGPLMASTKRLSRPGAWCGSSASSYSLSASAPVTGTELPSFAAAFWAAGVSNLHLAGTTHAGRLTSSRRLSLRPSPAGSPSTPLLGPAADFFSAAYPFSATWMPDAGVGAV